MKKLNLLLVESESDRYKGGIYSQTKSIVNTQSSSMLIESESDDRGGIKERESLIGLYL